MRRLLLAALALAVALPVLSNCSSSSDEPGADAPPGDGGADDGADAGPAFTPPPPPSKTPVSAPLVGSGGFGFAVGSAFPGAAAPQGLMKVGPDTSGEWGTIGFLHEGGYWYPDDTILGFSHLHLHGTGATDYGVLGVMPVASFDPAHLDETGWESKFSHVGEEAAPGYYAVTLDRGGIRAEMTATEHVAHHRWTFAKTASTGHVVVDLDRHLSGVDIASAELVLDPDARRIAGKLRTSGGMSGGFELWFEARTKQPWTSAKVWSKDAPLAEGTSASGTKVGAALELDVKDGAPVEMQLAVSFVSAAGAAANLAAEMPAWDFDATRAATGAAWRSLLDLVRVEGGSEVERGMLEAMLYHLWLMPTRVGDADGTYVGFDGATHQAAGFRYVSDMSLWDTYRTLHPLYALLTPDRARDAVRSLATMGAEGGFFPKWPIATGEAGSMIGAGAEVVLADAWLKGITDFDADGAYAILRAAAMDDVAPAPGRGGRGGIEDYLKLGYQPATRDGSVSLTIEWAQDDFALAALAGGLGHADDAQKLQARSHGWRALFDPKDGFLWPKNADGTFTKSRDEPTILGKPFVEANAWQTLWGAPQDLDGLVALFGSKEATLAKLTEFFEQGKLDRDGIDFSNVVTAYAPRPYYWGGNEPDIHAPWLFARLGRPDLTQKWVRWSMRTLYGPAADGLPGNDDGGTMSAWYVFAAMGLYPIVGTDRYVVGAPLFPHMEVALLGGKLTIDAPEVSTENLYVQSATLNGAPLAKAELRHADLAGGASLAFTMGPSPGAWGRD